MTEHLRDARRFSYPDAQKVVAGMFTLGPSYQWFWKEYADGTVVYIYGKNGRKEYISQ